MTDTPTADTPTAEELAVTPELARHLVAQRQQGFPAPVRTRARYLLLDGIACGLVGAQLPWSRRAVAGTLAVDGGGQGATVWGWGRQASPAAAALLNGTFVQGYELDDFHPHAALHSCAVVLPAALAAAEQRGGVSFGELLSAAAAGLEAGTRTGTALGGAKATLRGWHSGAVFGPVAAAVAAGSVLGLDSEQLESAIGNAATRAGALMAAQYKSMVKRMHHGMAAQAGLHGAALAAAGFTGIERVIEHEYGGLASTLLGGVERPDLQRLSSEFGQRWEMLGIGIKRHACLIMLHSSVDALLDWQRETATPLAEITGIEIGVSESVHARSAWAMEPPGSPLSAQLNLRCAAAVALLDGAAQVAQFSPDSLARPELWSLMERIEVRHDPSIDALGRDRRFVSRLRITTTAETVELTGIPPQDRDFDEAGVVAKFRALLDPIMAADRIERIERFVLDPARDSAEVGELIALLADPVDPALPDTDPDEEDHR